MPESYLHVRCARQAIRVGGVPKYDVPAVVAGAAGPDILFYHMGLFPLVRLGLRMHRERCGPFLTALVRGADSDVLRGYALGFLSHNAADATLHPWIAANEGNHAALESGIDSRYLLRDKGRVHVQPGDCAARLRKRKAMEIAGLFCRCVEEVYGVHLSRRTVARSFTDLYRVKALLGDRHEKKRRLVLGVERTFKLEGGTLSGHFTPGAPLDLSDHELAELDGLVQESETQAAGMMSAAQAYWEGAIGPLELSRAIGSRSYENGESV